MEDERSRVFGSSNQTRGNKDGRREGEWSVGMADAEVCKRCAEILRVSQLLSLIH